MGYIHSLFQTVLITVTLLLALVAKNPFTMLFSSPRARAYSTCSLHCSSFFLVSQRDGIIQKPKKGARLRETLGKPWVA